MAIEDLSHHELIEAYKKLEERYEIEVAAHRANCRTLNEEWDARLTAEKKLADQAK